MGILDELMEKKDIQAYIRARIAQLTRQKADVMNRVPANRKEMMRQRFDGRITELTALSRIISSGKLKQHSCTIWDGEVKAGNQMLIDYENTRGWRSKVKPGN